MLCNMYVRTSINAVVRVFITDVNLFSTYQIKEVLSDETEKQRTKVQKSFVLLQTLNSQEFSTSVR